MKMLVIRNFVIVYICAVLGRLMADQIYHDTLLTERLREYTAETLFTVTYRYKIETAICEQDQYVYYGTIPGPPTPAPPTTTATPTVPRAPWRRYDRDASQLGAPMGALSGPTTLNARLNQNFDYGKCGGPVYNVGDSVLAYYNPDTYARVFIGRKQYVVLALSNESVMTLWPFMILLLCVGTCVTIVQKIYRKTRE